MGWPPALRLRREFTASADALAAEVQSKLNGTASLTTAGNSVAGFAIRRRAHHLARHATVLHPASLSPAAMAPATFWVRVPITTAGVDVAGTINGVAALGTGQTLTAVAGTLGRLEPYHQGRPLGTRGMVNFSRGSADRLNKLAGDLLTTDGILASRVDGLAKSIKDIDRRQEVSFGAWTAIEARYRAQFTALDTMLSSLNQTSQFLTQQLATLPKNNS